MGSAAENPWRVILLAGLTAGAVCLGLLWPLHVTAVGGRAGIETAVLLLALLSALLLGSRFRRTRRIDDLVLAGVVATAGLAELAFATVPAIAGLKMVAEGNGAVAGVTAAVSVAIAGMALAPPHGEIRWRRRRPTRPAASVFAGPRIPAGLAMLLLIAACLLLTSAGLQGLLSRQAADWVTPGDGLRLVAYGIVVAVAVRRHAEMREALGGSSAERGAQAAGA